MSIPRSRIELVALVVCLLGLSGALGQITKGPSTLLDPFLVPMRDDVEIISLISAAEGEPFVDGYFLTGATEGLAAYDNGDATFTVLVNHEIPYAPDIPFIFDNPQPFHAHGGRGAHVSK